MRIADGRCLGVRAMNGEVRLSVATAQLAGSALDAKIVYLFTSGDLIQCGDESDALSSR